MHVDQNLVCDSTSTLTIDVSNLGNATAYLIYGYSGSVTSGGFSLIVPKISGIKYTLPIFNHDVLQYLTYAEYNANKSASEIVFRV